MRDIKNNIYKLLQENSGLSIQEIGNKLKISSMPDFVILNKKLNELEDEYQISRDEDNKYYLFSQLGLHYGPIVVNRKGFGFLDLEQEDSLFINRDNLIGAMNKDLVVVKRFKKNEAQVIKIVKRANEYCIGTITYRNRRIWVDLDDERLNGKVKVLNERKFKLVSGTKVQFKIIDYNFPMQLEIMQIIGHKDDPGVDIQSILLNYQIEAKFPTAVEEEIKNISEFISAEERKSRVDLCNELIVTIDGDDAKDFDDAISIEKNEDGFKLGVHIADVSHYITENSALDIEAYHRGTSTYVVDRVVPMLPKYLSNGVCSLNPKVERLTISCVMQINQQGEVVDYQIFPSIIKSFERMTYNNVNKVLQKDRKAIQKYEHLQEMFNLMKQCALVIRNRRERKGCIDFDRDEAKIIVNEKGKVKDIALRDRGESERIIEDFMICANETVAKHMKWLDLPTIYRIHEQPMKKKLREFAKISLIFQHKFKGDINNIHPLEIQKCLNEFKDDEAYPIISSIMLRTMSKARYDAKPIGHFGLALEDYLHFTSPIRRYPDLIVHRMLRKYVFNQNINLDYLKKDELKMADIAEQCSLNERRSIDAEREVEDMKKAEYMERNVGLIYQGIISSVTKFGFFVELPNTIEGLVHITSLTDDYYVFREELMSLVGEHTKKTYRIGDPIKVKCIAASKQTKSIDFAIFKPRGKKKQKWI